MIPLLLLLACPSKPDSGPSDTGDRPVDPTDTDTDPTDTDTDPTDPNPDRDQDGYETPEDCDDANSTVHPGAEDIPGNGLDEDCDGVDLPDADGDLHGDAAAGGDDCDDTNPWVHPGATEYCDPVDQDCDGVAIAPGGCEGLQEPKAWATWVFEEGFGESGFRDLTGDGVGEIVAGGPGARFPYDGDVVGPVWAIYTGVPDMTPVKPTASAAQVVVARDHCEGVDAGDVTGDGLPDLAFFGVFSYGGWVVPGPLPMDGSLIDAWDSDLVWEGAPRHLDAWCWQVILGGDLDGDGTNDALCTTEDYVGDATFEFFRGGQFGPSAMEARYGPDGGSSSLTLFPDLDGDGANELAGPSMIVDGASIAAGIDMIDSVISQLPAAYSYYFSAVSDRSGDGVPELTLGTEEPCVGSTWGSVYVFDGTLRGDVELDQALGCFVGSDEVGVAGARDIDLDGDGEREFLLLGGGHTVIATPVSLPTWGEPALDWGLTLENVYVRAFPVANIGNLDTAGTGDDILYYIPNDDAEEWNSYLYPGWDVPWFDRTYWPTAE